MDLYKEIYQMKQTQQEILCLLRELRNNGVVENKEQLYDLTDLEKMLRVSRRSIFNWKSEGKMKFSQIGKKIYITDSELKRFLETNKRN